MFHQLLNLLLDPRLALVHATLTVGGDDRLGDTPVQWANNQDDDLTLADLAAAESGAPRPPMAQC